MTIINSGKYSPADGWEGKIGVLGAWTPRSVAVKTPEVGQIPRSRAIARDDCKGQDLGGRGCSVWQSRRESLLPWLPLPVPSVISCRDPSSVAFLYPARTTSRDNAFSTIITCCVKQYFLSLVTTGKRRIRGEAAERLMSPSSRDNAMLWERK